MRFRIRDAVNNWLSHVNEVHQSTMDLSFLTPVIFCILITETVERFAFFGFRAVLVLYFVNSLHFSEETAIALYAYVISLAYASPLLGAFLADGYLGRYMTILCLGWIYAMGLGVLTLGAYTEDDLDLRRTLSFVGLFLFCLGTGGIKPCVSAFGADQVAAIDEYAIYSTDTDLISRRPSSVERVRAFFASFYFCINLGAVTSICTIPIVKHHFGYGAAFLLPTISITIAMLVFLSRRRDYVHSVPGQGDSSLTTTFSLSVWIARRELGRNHYIGQTFPCIIPTKLPIQGIGDEDDDAIFANQQVADAKQALGVLPILCMFPVFWMLYDQHSSVWTLQATRMRLYGLQAEQLVVLNPVEIMIFIPLFERVLYPYFEGCGFNISHLSRMRWGMFLTAVSFSMSGFVEAWIQASEENTVSVFWQLPQITMLTISEILVCVTGLEFAYSVSPERLKAFIMGIYLVMSGVGNLVGGLLYSSVFRHLNRATVMQVCAILMLFNLAVFYCVSKGWEKRRDEGRSEDMELEAARRIRDPLRDPPRYLD
jgi:proton-dependent oligopeptide transporter, POT family